jgi:hypothetical protein
LLPGKLLPVVAIHPLVGSRANRLSRVEPSAGTAQPHTRCGSSKPRAPLEYPIRELPTGKDQEPLTTLGEGSNNLQLRAQSPPLLQAVYHVGKHGRVTRNPQQLEDQVPLECKSQVMHLNLSQSHSRCATKQRDKWRGCSLAQRMSQGLKCASFDPKPGHRLFKVKG